MRHYETITIMDPDLSEDGRTPVLERIQDVIAKEDGTLVEFDHWGNRKLAYEIRKKTRGYYVRIDYCGNGAVVDEMERFFKIDDRVIKYMTILLDEKADPEKLLAEKAAAQAQTEAVEETPAAGEEASEPAPAPPETDTTSTDTEQEG